MVAPDTAPIVSAPSVPDDLPLFVFGSLRDADMLALVLGCAPSHVVAEPAGLGGFRCRRIEGDLFPILVSEPQVVEAEAVVSGVLLHGLTQGDLDRILFYEGSGYALRPVVVTPARVPRRRTWARVFLATSLLPDSGIPWDFAAWTEEDKPRALALTGEVMARYRVSVGEGDRSPREETGTRHLAVSIEVDEAEPRPEVCP